MPWLADKYGRRLNTVINQIVFMLAFLGLMFANTITELYVLLFIAGTTFGTRVIVAINYILEYFPEKTKETVVFVKVISGPIKLIIVTIVF